MLAGGPLEERRQAAVCFSALFVLDQQQSPTASQPDVCMPRTCCAILSSEVYRLQHLLGCSQHIVRTGMIDWWADPA